MSQNLNQFPTPNSDNSNALDLVELWLILWNKKWLIIVLSFLSCAGILAYSLTLPNMYKSSVLLSPQQEQQSSGLSSLAGQFGGLASVAGINLGGSSDKTAVYLEIIKSKDFLYKFIEKNNVKVNLFAAKKWDKDTEELELDDTIYKNGKWLVDEETQKTLEPTLYEAYEYFVKKLTVKEDKVTGLVEISYEHIDPRIAKTYVENIVTLINKSVREREIAENKESIKYLNEELANTNIAEMQNVFYTIIEEQTKSMLLAKVRKEFAFKVIESPIVEEQKSSPNRAVICILGAVFSVFFICITVLLIHFIRENKSSNARS
ncbi:MULTISPECIES: Wzz/FepE/Etk N-terminal domain-containing protein [unclassified Pseudoalteromonas]|uniref:Wzz/FepE/Etk N-terminal domain-containing protein n=1 Tax=unclassified Pseudoalteromonas TaxID=194690 RepID=UPI001407DC01|nr:MULTISPECIES: Wzz/FepE/Etk N-terminal domain-containing protein [unclassified Pseudoalteromonas]MBH0025397.1 lipopolysaccharide biosynthesis protein [Pseudoalteromonas sp. SWN29]